ncbi:hypothetical protein AVL61_13750 [Kocuria rosea subsp. polaris]|uniref:Uncharacterized protein n=1 Tax=Kocuria rosea subsp. polaris TaxID=136273 RepID=A0A0W8ILN3_KOCRO|nr:hypothetical protein AVL61_13750 [Kocuria polaris]
MPLAAAGNQQMTLRRAPNIWAFVLLGGVLGAVVGVLVGLAGGGSAEFTQGAVTLFMVSVCTVLGLAAGAVLALVLDRVSVALARAVTTEVVDGDGGAPSGAPADAPRPTDPRSSREG